MPASKIKYADGASANTHVLAPVFVVYQPFVPKNVIFIIFKFNILYIIVFKARVSMSNKIIVSPKAPKPIGPYSQAVETGGFIFTSGIIPMDPVTGEIAGGDVKTQTETVLKNIENILAADKLELKHIVKTTVYMTDLTYFAEMNEAYAAFFKENPPARTTMQVAAMPKGALIQIEAVARK